MEPEFEQMIRQFPEALATAYVTAQEDQTVTLAAGDMVLRQGDLETPPAPGRVFWRWKPLPGMAFAIDEVETVLPVRGPGEAARRPLGLGNAELRLLPSNSCWSVDLNSFSLFRGACSGRVEHSWQDLCQLDRVIFHLPNFHPYHGDPIRSIGTRPGNDGEPIQEVNLRRGRLILTDGPWEVTLDEVQDARELRRRLDAEGGFAITNVGRLVRRGAETFSSNQAEEMLTALQYFFSFCLGRWSSPVLAVGDLEGERVWRDWTNRRCRAWTTRLSWFPGQNYGPVGELNGAFAGFMERWRSPLWGEPLRHAIHWYLEANTNAGGIEGGIIMSLTALELLSWLHLVEDESTPAGARMSANQFDRLEAKDRIERLLNTLGVPSDLPNVLPKLAAAVAAQRGEAGAATPLARGEAVATLVKLRHEVVHPKRSHRESIARAGVPARIEALSLAITFVELALLRLFGYRGMYYPRLGGGTELDGRARVPWA